MNIFITGGVGFIGANSAIYFAKKKHKITIIDNFSRSGVIENAQFLRKFKNIKIIKTEIYDLKNYLDELRRADVVIHLAAQTAVTTSIKNPSLDFKSNILAGFTLLENVRKYCKDAIILYSSTNKVYGNLEHHLLKKVDKEKRYKDTCHPLGIDENEKIEFISPYGCSKGALDFYFQDYYRIYGLKTVVFRQSCIYGPYQIGVEDQGWVAHFSKQFLSKQPITVFGDGYQVRDLLYVEDLIRAYDKTINNIKTVKGSVFNIGGGIRNSLSLLQVIEMLKKVTKNSISISFKKPRLGDQKYFVSANLQIKKKLSWQPKTYFSEGLNKLIEWQKANLK